MKSVLILTASVGEGHNKAAYSLEDTFRRNGYNVTTVDFIKKTSKLLNLCIVGGYKSMVFKYPKLYGGLYRITNVDDPCYRVSKCIKAMFETGVTNIINETRPDIIIGTHAFAALIVSNLKGENKINVPFISVITDFQAHYAYINNNVDAYIVGSRYTKQDMIRKGVAPSKIFTYGIPIRRDFFDTSFIDKNFDKKCFTILVMGGGLGAGRIDKVLKNIMSNKHNLKIIVICGNNSALRRYLIRRYDNKNEGKVIDILGYVNEISRVMTEADIIISKPGGLTVSEAVAKKLPMIIPFSIPGQEEENARFLTASGVAIELSNLSKLNSIVDELISSPQILCSMRKNMEQLVLKNSSKDIVLLANELIGRKIGEFTNNRKVNHMTFNKVTGNITLL
ncbi:MAG: glycosyltransferase [Bacillota bacterium]|nr:glycosyltransferase [Bacillota bacterium]